MLPSSASPRDVHRVVWGVAWPSVLTFSLMTSNSILDRMFVGWLGRDALAAVGVGGQVLFLLVSVSMAITTGTTAIVARFIGAGQLQDARRATGQSLALGVVTGAVGMAAAYAGSAALLDAINLAPEAERACRAFLHTALLGTVPMFLLNVMSAALRGLGDMRTPLKVMLAANAVHLVGNWTLMLGNWGFPRLGVAGGGIALSASHVVALAVMWVYLRRSPLRGSESLSMTVLRVDWAKRILRIGIPAAVTALLRITSLLGFTKILAATREGTNAVAALPIGLTAESIAFMPGFGFSVAASALVGQRLGAQDPKGAERYAWSATWMAVLTMSAMGAVFFLAAEPFARLFTSDPRVLPVAVSYLRIMAISEPFLALGMVLTGALQGAGDTMRPTVLTAIIFWGLRIPLAHLLAIVLGWQAAGAWTAMAISTVVGGLLTVLLFRDGRWKRVRV
ncbi:MAG TPA: MATE family efflux transporter [Chthonomonadales bacterium]|nr:MATE family efflux transporter [Chthonomonadales bacterium]